MEKETQKGRAVRIREVACEAGVADAAIAL